MRARGGDVTTDDQSKTEGRRPAAALMPAEYYVAIIEHVADPIFIKDRDFRFVLVNRAFERLVGIPREDIVGKTDYDISPAAEADFFRQKDTEMFATGSVVTIDEEQMTDRTGRRRVLSTSKVPLRDEHGTVVRLVGIIHDITPLKAGEEALRVANEELERRVKERTAALEAAQAELVRKERLAVLGQLAGGLAHQIRNPLGAISNAAYVLKRTMVDPCDDAQQAVEIVLSEAWQANRIITDLLDYARVRPPDRRLVPVSEIVERALGSQTFPENVEIDVAIPEGLAVAVDAAQVCDAIENLLTNAVEAMPDGGLITLDARADGDQCRLTITDTGTGIPEEIEGRLFEPLVTTKPCGLGLGLTTARALIDSNGGSIDYRTTPDEGTSFEVRLPTS